MKTFALLALFAVLAFTGFALAAGTHPHGRLFKCNPGHPCTTSSTTTTGTTTGTTTSGEPGPIAGQGYTLAFSDTFDTLDANPDGTLSDTKRWGKLWYQANWPAGRVFVQNSILHLQASITAPVAISTRRVTLNGSTAFVSSASGGVYFEARMRWQSGAGTYPQFWSLSVLHAFGYDCGTTRPPGYEQYMTGQPLLNSELDFMEGSPTPGTWWGTLHRNTGSACGVPDTQNGGNTHLGVTQDAFHTWAAKWTGTGTGATVSWYLDDVLKGTTAGYDSTSMPLFPILASVQRNVTGAPAINDTQFDWVRVWKK